MELQIIFVSFLCISAALFPLTSGLIARPKPSYQTLQLPPDWQEATSQNLPDVEEANRSSSVVSVSGDSRNVEVPDKKLVCYYNAPTMYDQPFPVYPEQINPFLCTHLILSFAHVQNSSIVPARLEDLEVS